MTENSFLIIGLGNPGREFRDNRHNVGFMVIDRLVIRLNVQGMKLQSKAIVINTWYEGNKLIFAKPQTYMNLSGHSIQGLANFYKLPLENLLVVYDDLDLPFGTLRLRPGGGPGGQKGIASAIERLGTKDFARLRIGIGRPAGKMDPADFVLQDFSRDEMKNLSEILDRASDAVLSFVLEGLDVAMNKYNGELKA